MSLKTIAKRFTYLCSMLLFVGCGVTDLSNQSEQVQEQKKVQEEAQLRGVVEPNFSFRTPTGTVLKFYYGKNHSMGLAEEGKPGQIFITHLPELKNASPKEILWSITTPTQAIPKEVSANHRALFLVGEQPRVITTRQGWLSKQLKSQNTHSKGGLSTKKSKLIVDAPGSDPCGSFVQSNTCSQAGTSFPHGPGCWMGHKGWLNWNKSKVLNYRASACSVGTYKHDVTYKRLANVSGACGYFKVWFPPLRSGNYTNNAWNYIWFGNSSNRREYTNKSQYISGPGYAWGVKTKVTPCPWW